MKTGENNSDPASATFTLSFPQLAVTLALNLPSGIVLSGGTLLTTQPVIITATPSAGVTIHYTTDGTMPTSSSASGREGRSARFRFNTPGTRTIRAIGVKDKHLNSDPISTTFTVIRPPIAGTPDTTPPDTPSPGSTPKVATPTFNLDEILRAHVTISTSTEGATIYYSTDGSDPITAGPAAASSVRVNFGSTRTGDITIKAVARKEGYDNSAEASTTFTIIRPPIAVLPDTPTPEVTVTITIFDPPAVLPPPEGGNADLPACN